MQITLVLLHHLYHPQESPLLPYLVNLPKRPLSPIYTFNSDESSLLKGDPMHSSIQEGQDDLIQLYSQVNRVLDTLSQADRLVFLNGRHSLPVNDFLLANYIIETRSYNMRGKKYLVPGGDFINHHDPQEMANLLDKSTQSQGAQFLRTHRLVNDRLHVSVSSSFGAEQ